MRFKSLYYLLPFIMLFMGGSCGKRVRTTPYVIARHTNLAELNLHGNEKNVLGFIDDLLFQIAEDQKIKIRLISTEATPITSLLSQEKIDAVLTTLTLTEVTQTQYHYSEPLFVFGPVLVVQKNAPYSQAKELQGKLIGFERGDTSVLLLTQNAHAQFLPYDSATLAFEALYTGRVDGVIVDSFVAHRLASTLYEGDVRILAPPLAPVNICLVVKKGKSEELIELVNTGLDTLKKEGFYQKVLRYWSLFDADIPST